LIDIQRLKLIFELMHDIVLLLVVIMSLHLYCVCCYS